jgi:hypothetical protein
MGVAGSQLMSTAVHRSPNKLWRSNSIFNLCCRGFKFEFMSNEPEFVNLFLLLVFLWISFPQPKSIPLGRFQIL